MQLSVDNSTALAYALQYALRGWCVLPVQVWYSTLEAKYKKHPLIKDWPNQATCDPDVVRDMFGRTDLKVSIGALTGPDSFYVVDVDPRNGGTTEGLSSTLVSKTISGGFHYFYRSEKRIPSGILRKGVDFKGIGGFVVLPGSEGYEWSA